MTTLPDPVSGPDGQRALNEALANCAREPIHLIGSIQPFGVLLAVDAERLMVHAASANLDSIFALGAAEAIGQPLLALIGAQQLAWLEALQLRPAWSGPKS